MAECGCGGVCEGMDPSKRSRAIYKPRLRHRRTEFLEFLEETRFQPLESVTEEWWSSNVTTVHKTIPLQCVDCGYTVRPKFDNFFGNTYQRGTARCRCSGKGKWDCEEGRRELLDHIEASGFIAHGFLTSSEEYAQKTVNSRTYIPIQCVKCGDRPRNCRLQHFMTSGVVGCACKWKTQQMVREWTETEIERVAPGSMRVITESHFRDVRSPAGRAMPYDIVVFQIVDKRVLLIIEVDGRQHFDSAMTGIDIFNGLQRRDMLKEIDAVQRNVPMVRLHQPSVWKGTFDWKPYMAHMILRAWEQTLPLKVFRQPSEASYVSGSYASLRIGTVVEV